MVSLLDHHLPSSERTRLTPSTLPHRLQPRLVPSAIDPCHDNWRSPTPPPGFSGPSSSSSLSHPLSAMNTLPSFEQFLTTTWPSQLGGFDPRSHSPSTPSLRTNWARSFPTSASSSSSPYTPFFAIPQAPSLASPDLGARRVAKVGVELVPPCRPAHLVAHALAHLVSTLSFSRSRCPGSLTPCRLPPDHCPSPNLAPSHPSHHAWRSIAVTSRPFRLPSKDARR